MIILGKMSIMGKSVFWVRLCIFSIIVYFG